MTTQAESFFPVVGVGASAGGLEAFRELLSAIPSNPGMAFILVQHLSTSHESRLTAILQKATTLPVVEIGDKMPVEPNHVYVIPSSSLLTIKDNLLLLDPIIKGDKLNTIDLFFTSLAEMHQEHSFGLLLSGTGDDGTIGLKTIKDQGGITMVQERAEVGHFEMAKNALDADVVDFVLPPALMPGQILQILSAGDGPLSIKGRLEDGNEPESFKRILALIRAKRGVDFTYYKQSTIHRRILRRRAMTGMDSLKSYTNLLFENKSEQDALFKDLLIPVTAFFRDSTSFQLLKTEILPALFGNGAASEAKRIWVAGCSTGEEAYSIAICLQEYFTDPTLLGNIQIFATDISDISIAKARSGIYSRQNMAGVSEERLNRFFSKTDGGYQVNKSIRDMCVFAAQNFLQDPPFSKIDLVCCRNVLIYMEAYLQKRALTTFHYSLKINGVLFLGRSESVGTLSQEFIPVSHHDKFYRRNAAAGRLIPIATTRKPNGENEKTGEGRRIELRKDDFQKAADDALLEKFAAVGVLINEQMDILQFRGATGGYLEAPAGKATHNLLKMAKEGLAFELRNALAKTKNTQAAVQKTGIPLEKGRRSVDIEVIPLRNTIEIYYLVLFSENLAGARSPRRENKKSANQSEGHTADLQQLHISNLEKELAQAREDMRAITEGQEAANEELQSANEELLSGSEELQTLNEELETSKEEIQSSNEELSILNQELIDRNDQLIHARRYSDAIIATLHEPLVVLTNDFRIKTANKCFYDTFGTTEKQTEGRHFFEWKDGLWNIPALRTNLQNILPHSVHFDDQPVTLIIDGGKKDFDLNARQIVNENSTEQLILLAMADVTDRKALQNAQETFARELEAKIKEQTKTLTDLNEGLRYSNESLKQFNSIASHDLQEPLRKIRTFAAMLEKAFAKSDLEGSKGLIDKIKISVERMSRLIKDVLEFSKVERANRQYSKTDLSSVLDSVLGDLDMAITDKGATITCPRPLPVIDAIPLQMQQLLYNLLANSLKFSRPGEVPQIVLTYRFLSPQGYELTAGEPESGTLLELTISDNGIGFDQQFAGQIFTLFERLHSTDEYEGTGVGLALCTRVVDNHHGSISARSAEGSGASFIVVLPVSQSQAIP